MALLDAVLHVAAGALTSPITRLAPSNSAPASELVAPPSKKSARLVEIVSKMSVFATKGISEALRFCYHSAMPTVLRLDGLRVIIYPNDHRPAHVHVKGAVGEAVFILPEWTAGSAR